MSGHYPPGVRLAAGAKSGFSGDARRAWRLFAKAAQDAARGAPVGEMSELRKACMGAAFPVEGPSAKAGSNALLEFARTFATAEPRRRDQMADALKEIARYCDALLDEALEGSAALTRRMMGEDD